MIEFLSGLYSNLNLSALQWVLTIMAAVLLGMSKAGISSISIITVSLLAWIFGSRSSTGILLPMLIVADVFAVFYYRQHAQWSYLLRLLPWMVVGVLLGVWLGKDIDERIFKKIMAGTILLSVIAMFWRERSRSENIPTHWSFAGFMGLGAGFTTMVGNLAGGFSNVYFLSMRLPKNHFIGTAAWLFFIINMFKLPFHIFSWKTITVDSIGINLALLPFLIIGFFIGKRMVFVMAEARYRQMIMWLTAASVCFILLG